MIDHKFIVTYGFSDYEVFANQDDAIAFAREHGGKLYLIRYHEHNDEMLPYSTPVEI